MAFDGIMTRTVINELKNTLIGGKVNKIFQPNKNEIIIDIYNKEKFLLNVCIESSNYRVNLTTHTKSNPKIAPNFCMVLRKYLISSKIINIYTYNLDRIAIIEFESYNELNDIVQYKLIIELMGKHSNIILLNNMDIIIDSIRHISSENSLRTILPANPYIFPASDKLNLLNMNSENFIESITSANSKDLLSILSNNFTGISKSFAFFTLNKLNISLSYFDNNVLNNLFNYIQKIIIAKNIACTEFEFNNKKDFTIFSDEKQNKSIAINSFLDEFYYTKESNETFINYRNTVLKLILSLLKKYNKKLITIQNKLDDCKYMDKFKLYGELITANLYRINNNINVPSIQLENYYNNKLIDIELDCKFPPSLNAKNFFKKYNKLKNTLSIVSSQKEDILSEISYIESIIYSLENSSNSYEVDEIYQEISDNILKQNKKTSKKIDNELKIKEITIDNYKVYVGKNNKQNDYITFKLSDKNDLWFHVQGFHGSHVLLKTNNTEIDDINPIILKCAKLATLNSKAANESKTLVDYTLIKNIKKPNGAKPGFVIFNSHKTIIVTN